MRTSGGRVRVCHDATIQPATNEDGAGGLPSGQGSSLRPSEVLSRTWAYLSRQNLEAFHTVSPPPRRMPPHLGARKECLGGYEPKLKRFFRMGDANLPADQ